MTSSVNFDKRPAPLPASVADQPPAPQRLVIRLPNLAKSAIDIETDAPDKYTPARVLELVKRDYGIIFSGSCFQSSFRTTLDSEVSQLLSPRSSGKKRWRRVSLSNELILRAVSNALLSIVSRINDTGNKLRVIRALNIAQTVPHDLEIPNWDRMATQSFKRDSELESSTPEKISNLRFSAWMIASITKQTFFLKSGQRQLPNELTGKILEHLSLRDLSNLSIALGKERMYPFFLEWASEKARFNRCLGTTWKNTPTYPHFFRMSLFERVTPVWFPPSFLAAHLDLGLIEIPLDTAVCGFISRLDSSLPIFSTVQVLKLIVPGRNYRSAPLQKVLRKFRNLKTVYVVEDPHSRGNGQIAKLSCSQTQAIFKGTRTFPINHTRVILSGAVFFAFSKVRISETVESMEVDVRSLNYGLKKAIYASGGRLDLSVSFDGFSRRETPEYYQNRLRALNQPFPREVTTRSPTFNVSLSGCHVLNGTLRRLLGTTGQLRSITLDGCSGSLVPCTNAPLLTSLDLSDFQSTTAGITGAEFFAFYPNLKRLSFHSSSSTFPLSSLEDTVSATMEEFKLWEESVSSEDLRRISRAFPNLKCLEFHEPSPNDIDLSQLGYLESLERFWLHSHRVPLTGSNLERLGRNSPNLKVLRITNTQVSDISNYFSRQFRKLTSLMIGEALSLGDSAFLNLLETCKELTHISLSNSLITGAMFTTLVQRGHILTFPTVTFLDLSRNEIPVEHLASLLKFFPNLKTLKIHNLRCSVETLDRNRQDLKKLQSEYARVTIAGRYQALPN